MSKTTVEWMDDVATGDRIVNIRIAKADKSLATLTDFDQLLFDDIENGEPSNTPMADQLLGLETLVRRIEEATQPNPHKEQL